MKTAEENHQFSNPYAPSEQMPKSYPNFRKRIIVATLFALCWIGPVFACCFAFKLVIGGSGSTEVIGVGLLLSACLNLAALAPLVTKFVRKHIVFYLTACAILFTAASFMIYCVFMVLALT